MSATDPDSPKVDLSTYVAPGVVPPVSGRQHPTFAGRIHRTAHAAAFHEGAQRYADVRPGYPAEIIAPIRQWQPQLIADIGAGTGKLTLELLAAGIDTVALDPSADMIRALGMAVDQFAAEYDVDESPGRLRGSVTGIAEDLPFATDSVDGAVIAQSWHWIEHHLAAAELDRVIRPGGKVLLVWNTLDVRQGWIHRLSRIMHSGDILRPDFVPPVPQPWTIAHTERLIWQDTISAANIIELAHTRSYWLKSSPQIRQRVDNNLQWYLYEHLGLQPQQHVELPYRCDGFVLHRDNRAV